MKKSRLIQSLRVLLSVLPLALSAGETVDSVEALMNWATQSGNEVTMKPGVYRVNDYLTPERLEAVRENAIRLEKGRPPMPLLEFSGSNNTFNLHGVVLEVDTSIYDHLPKSGYHRFFFISGDGNLLAGVIIRYVGPNQGTNGNCISLWGDRNTLEDVVLYVHGSRPYGYGDLFGKGKNKLTTLQKQSGIMIGGDHCRLRRCQVISRAFGHCFYIQGARDTVLEDCYAEGEIRTTNDMLAERGGQAEDLDYRSVYENRDGRFEITPGYTKSLTEDGFRTYGLGGPRNQTTGKVTLINCLAINTRAGFEIVGPPEGESTELIGCTALGTERGFLLINGNIITRRCRGNMTHGPLLYLWGGSYADVEIELIGGIPATTVHAAATISGTGHRVKLTHWEPSGAVPHLPIMLGFGMPAHAEMSTPILPEKATDITLINQVGLPVVESGAE